MIPCSGSEDISLGRHALTSLPRLTPRLGLSQSMSPSTDIFRAGTQSHSWFSYSRTFTNKCYILPCTTRNTRWVTVADACVPSIATKKTSVVDQRCDRRDGSCWQWSALTLDILYRRNDSGQTPDSHCINRKEF